MGTISVKIEVGDLQGRNFEEVELEVNPRSIFTALPRGMLNALGVQVDRIEQMVFPDGTLRPVDMGHTQIRLGGQQFPTSVIFADEGEHSVLGSVALTMADLDVDPVNNTLIPRVIRR